MQTNEPAEYALLGLLQTQPMHGYEMFQQFENGTLGQIVHLEMSQLYAYLKKLERLGYIQAQLEPQGSRPPRKTFQLTDEGQTEFLKWLSEPVERPREIRILFLLKLYYARRFIPEQLEQLIDQQIAACRRFLTHLEAQRPETALTDDQTFFDHVILRSRIHQTRALLDWLNELQHANADVRR